MENEKRKETLERIREQIAVLEREERNLVRLCPHTIEKHRDDYAVCEVCGEWFGWYCKESPDHCCHYYSTRNKDGRAVVILVDNSEYFLPENYCNDDYETDDFCLFCGDPAERK